MIVQSVGMRRTLLFAWAVMFVTLVRLQIPETTLLGVVTFALAVWAARVGSKGTGLAWREQDPSPYLISRLTFGGSDR